MVRRHGGPSPRVRGSSVGGLGGSRFRVGATGHRAFDDVDRVSAELAAVLDRVCADRDPAGLEVWSPLAEGADRLVASGLIERGATLIAVLPLPPDEYRLDFETAESQAEFDHLLGLAQTIRVVEPVESSRDAAYETAGLAVLDAVDVLVAIWDGEQARGRGGTADIVDEARRRGREVIVVPVTRDNV